MWNPFRKKTAFERFSGAAHSWANSAAKTSKVVAGTAEDVSKTLAVGKEVAEAAKPAASAALTGASFLAKTLVVLAASLAVAANATVLTLLWVFAPERAAPATWISASFWALPIGGFLVRAWWTAHREFQAKVLEAELQDRYDRAEARAAGYSVPPVQPLQVEGSWMSTLLYSLLAFAGGVGGIALVQWLMTKGAPIQGPF
jgi:hypothetical protein